MESDAATMYVHMCGRDVDDALLRPSSIETEKQTQSEFKTTDCSRCHVTNSPDAKYCTGCGLAFDLKYAVEADWKKEDISDDVGKLTVELRKSPEVVDALLKAMSPIKSK